MNLLEMMNARISERTREPLAVLADTRGCVKSTPEFRRVLGLPRHDWQAPTDLAAQVTEYLKLPGGTMTLRPVQAAALEHLYNSDGLLADIGCGDGKTLISYLAGTVLEVPVTLLLVPAKLREKTRRDFAELAKHWRQFGRIEVMSYEMLGRVEAAEYLETLAPDLIVADEAHLLRNMSASRTRRVMRYLQNHPAVRFAAMSGTMSNRSLKDFHHLMAAALRAEMPLPRTRAETALWARAVDQKVETRSRPGALVQFLDPGEDANLENIRAAVGRRIAQSPGVVYTSKDEVPTSIQMEYFTPPANDAVREHMARAVAKIAPNGDACQEADTYRHIRTLVQGFYYMWDPEPPPHWRKARAVWASFANEILAMHDPRYDSPLMVAQGCTRGDLPDYAYRGWLDVRDDYEINSRPEWVDDAPLRAVLAEVQGPTLIWVEHRAAGERLAALSGFPYFQAQGRDGDGNAIEDADPSGSLILSIASNAEGRNLQAWSQNFVVTPPPSGKTWEQLLSRTCRPGQLADTITVRVMLGHPKMSQAMETARNDARYVQQTTGTRQKLLLSDVV